MKTIWTAGSLLLCVTALTLVGATGVWLNYVRHGDFLFWHLLAMALIMAPPALLWRHKIEIDAQFLRLHSVGHRQQIRLAGIAAAFARRCARWHGRKNATQCE